MNREEELHVNSQGSRRQLMEDLNEVIQVALDKYSRTRASNKDRQSWGRLICSAVGEFGKLLKDVDLDDLLRRVEALEEKGGR